VWKNFRNGLRCPASKRNGEAGLAGSEASIGNVSTRAEKKGSRIGLREAGGISISREGVHISAHGTSSTSIRKVLLTSPKMGSLKRFVSTKGGRWFRVEKERRDHSSPSPEKEKYDAGDLCRSFGEKSGGEKEVRPVHAWSTRLVSHTSALQSLNPWGKKKRAWLPGWSRSGGQLKGKKNSAVFLLIPVGRESPSRAGGGCCSRSEIANVAYERGSVPPQRRSSRNMGQKGGASSFFSKEKREHAFLYSGKGSIFASEQGLLWGKKKDHLITVRSS